MVGVDWMNARESVTDLQVGDPVLGGKMGTDHDCRDSSTVCVVRSSGTGRPVVGLLFEICIIPVVGCCMPEIGTLVTESQRPSMV